MADRSHLARLTSLEHDVAIARVIAGMCAKEEIAPLNLAGVGRLIRRLCDVADEWRLRAIAEEQAALSLARDFGMQLAAAQSSEESPPINAIDPHAQLSGTPTPRVEASSPSENSAGRAAALDAAPSPQVFTCCSAPNYASVHSGIVVMWRCESCGAVQSREPDRAAALARSA